MFSDIGLESFNNIASPYQLQSWQFYRNLQLRKYLNEKVQLKSLKDLHHLIGYMAEKCHTVNTQSLTGQIYKILQGCGVENVNNIKENDSQKVQKDHKNTAAQLHPL